MTWADRILSFYQSLHIERELPEGVEVLNPFKHTETFELCSAFYRKYYSDNEPRRLILGINPGRYGAGLTGIPFTDPVKLEVQCGITNTLPKKAELSADFIYRVISAFGGPSTFYKKFYISSVSPLGFIMDRKNLNYYDSHELEKVVHEFFMKTIREQISFGIDTKKCICLGEGKNAAFLKAVNNDALLFKQIIALPHPRFIMQYRRKYVHEYIDQYLSVLS